MITKGQAIRAIFGCDSKYFNAPILNAPPRARIRVKFRNDSFATAFVKIGDVIEERILSAAEGGMILLDAKFIQSRNQGRS